MLLPAPVSCSQSASAHPPEMPIGVSRRRTRSILTLALGAVACLIATSALAAQATPGAAATAGITHSTAPTTPATLDESIVLAPHEAIYKMRLSRVASSAGIVGAGGTIRYVFNDSCDGWTVETHTNLTMLQTQGGPIRTAWDLLSWESKDGKSYRFHVRNSRNGEVIEAYQGEADLAEDGSGKAVFLTPDQQKLSFDLPPNTLLPVAHTLALLRQASKGKPFLSVSLFDGSAIQGAFQVSAVLGKAKAPRVEAIPQPANDISTDAASVAQPAIDRALLNIPSWPTTLAFFDPADTTETPVFEVHLDYYANGATDALLQDFGTFSLEGELSSLKALPRPKCAS